LLRLWNYLRGYVIILVEGYFVEKFINICTRRQILLWDVRMQKNHLVTMKVSIKGFKLIRQVAKKTRCRVKLLKKIGLPFILNRYRRRKAFFAGAVLFFVLVYVMSSFIWSIEISGNKEIDTSRIESVLAANGIRTGMLKYSINTKKAVTGMMLGMQEISWVSISVRGTKVKVELRERKPIPEIIQKDEPCDIVAVKDGIIKQVIATEGVEAVGEGDTVRKGQVLISGNIPMKGEDNKFRQVHAMGTVMARTWYEEKVPVRLTVIEKVKTGRAFNNYSLVLFSRKLDILNRKNKYKEFSVKEKRKKFSIGEDIVFPIEWITTTYYEEKSVKADINEKTAQEIAVEEAHRKLLERIPENAQVLNKIVKFIEDENSGSYAAQVTYECLEDIGVSRRIGGN